MGSILAATMSPAIVRASSLMPLVVRRPLWITMALPITAIDIVEGRIRREDLVEYSYDADLRLFLPPGAIVNRLWADGVEMDARALRDDGRIDRLPLQRFGNVVPTISAELKLPQ